MNNITSTKEYFVHPSSYIENDVSIGEGTHIWHFCHVLTGASIGKNCNIGQNVFIDKNVKVGNGVKLQNNVSVYACVELEDYVFCGPSMVFTNVMTPRAKYPKDISEYDKTVVHTGATIGANATVVCGNELGKWCMIAAGAVVTRNVPDYALMAGVPAKRIGWICECGEIISKERVKNAYACNKCGKKYIVVGGKLIQLQK
jgi:UDP-2-acetamido-3-amino-2,3-dideoxy-glucuronate N-acetyltransferase